MTPITTGTWSSTSSSRRANDHRDAEHLELLPRTRSGGEEEEAPLLGRRNRGGPPFDRSILVSVAAHRSASRCAGRLRQGPKQDRSFFGEALVSHRGTP